MGTTLTFHGQDADVELDDGTITLVSTRATAGGDQPPAGEAGRVVVPRSDVTGLELKPASLLAYGRLVISTRGGDTHTVQFAREEQGHFENLEAIIRP